MPTTDVNKLVLNVKRLTPDNIVLLDYAYKDKYGESIGAAIKNEWGLDDGIKNELISHINKCLYEECRR